MKIDEATINHNAMRLIKDEVCMTYDIDINAEDGKIWLMESIGENNDILKLADKLEEMLKV